MKKYGLQLRIPPDQQKKMASKPPTCPPSSIFGDDDDVLKVVSRSKPKSLQLVDEQLKKALEEDPLAFDYDAVYDEMKSNAARPRVQDQAKREPKFITSIIESAKKREREHEIVYERKLLKERNKDDHIYEDKEKFVTNAYRQKLAERTQWLEEERLRQLLEEKEDVTKKSDLTDFYFSLNKNAAFGAHSTHILKPSLGQSSTTAGKIGDTVPNTEAVVPSNLAGGQRDEKPTSLGFTEDLAVNISSVDPFFLTPQDKSKAVATTSTSLNQNNAGESSQHSCEDKKADAERFKRSQDAVTAARERFLARKKAKEQL